MAATTTCRRTTFVSCLHPASSQLTTIRNNINGIVSWEGKSDFKPVLIRGSEDYVKTKERWEILKIFFKEKNIDFWEVSSINGDVLSKIMCLIYLLDFSTIYRAVIIGMNPFLVKSIDYIKEHL